MVLLDLLASSTVLAEVKPGFYVGAEVRIDSRFGSSVTIDASNVDLTMLSISGLYKF